MPRLNEWVAADTFFSDVPAKAVAVGIMQAAKEDAETDLSDLFTKALTQRRRECLLAHLVCGPWCLESWLTGKKQKHKEEGEEEEEDPSWASASWDGGDCWCPSTDFKLLPGFLSWRFGSWRTSVTRRRTFVTAFQLEFAACMLHCIA